MDMRRGEGGLQFGVIVERLLEDLIGSDKPGQSLESGERRPKESYWIR